MEFNVNGTVVIYDSELRSCFFKVDICAFRGGSVEKKVLDVLKNLPSKIKITNNKAEVTKTIRVSSDYITYNVFVNAKIRTDSEVKEIEEMQRIDFLINRMEGNV